MRSGLCKVSGGLAALCRFFRVVFLSSGRHWWRRDVSALLLLALRLADFFFWERPLITTVAKLFLPSSPSLTTLTKQKEKKAKRKKRKKKKRCHTAYETTILDPMSAPLPPPAPTAICLGPAISITSTSHQEATPTALTPRTTPTQPTCPRTITPIDTCNEQPPRLRLETLVHPHLFPQPRRRLIRDQGPRVCPSTHHSNTSTTVEALDIAIHITEAPTATDTMPATAITVAVLSQSLSAAWIAGTARPWCVSEA